MKKLSLFLLLLTLSAGCANPNQGRRVMTDEFMLGKLAYEENDFKAAYAVLAPAAAAGNPNAQFYLGMMYDFGYGLETDHERANALYLQAAEQGQDDAQFNLAISYSIGEGIEQDDDKAIYWLSKSAASGDKDAMDKLDDYARDDYAAAQYALACVYRDGVRLHHDLTLYPSEDDNREIAPSPEIYRRWLQKAAAGNYAPAVQELRGLR
jgi:TPR repeat protein